MRTIETFRHLFSYNEWANRRALDSIKSQPYQSHKAIRAFTHLVIAEKTWLMRMGFHRNVDNTGSDFWPEYPIQESEALADETARRFIELLEELTEDGLETIATYKNSKGIEYRTKYRDVLMHVLMHSMYHRGQVAMAIRAEGGEPAYTDYIGYVRETES